MGDRQIKGYIRVKVNCVSVINQPLDEIDNIELIKTYDSVTNEHYMRVGDEVLLVSDVFGLFNKGFDVEKVYDSIDNLAINLKTSKDVKEIKQVMLVTILGLLKMEKFMYLNA